VEAEIDSCCSGEDITSVGQNDVAQCTVPVEVPAVSSCGGACCKRD